MQLLFVVVTVSCFTSLCHVWFAGYVGIASLAWQIARRLGADCDRRGVRGVRAHRLLWLHTEQVRESTWKKLNSRVKHV